LDFDELPNIREKIDKEGDSKEKGD